MVLPLIFGALGSALGGAGMLGGIGALGGAAIGSGLGGYAQTGDLETGLLTGLGAFAGGSLLGALGGGAAGAAGAANSPAVGAGLNASAAPAAAGAAALPLKANLATIGSAAAPMNVPASTGLMGLGKSAMNFASSPMGMATGIGGSVGGALAPMLSGGGGEDGGGNKGSGDKEMKPIPRNIQFPAAGETAGGTEFNYGFDVPSSGEVLNYRDRGIIPQRFADGGMISRARKMFGPIRLAEGGIAALVEEQDDTAAPQAAGGGNEKDVVAEAIRAIKGESPAPEVALGAFLAQYGEQALRDLVDQVEGGAVDETAAQDGGKLKGAGDGMDDLIPANIEGEQDVLLSDGEFVIPADVVSGLGNGSSDAGARELERMMDRVRAARTGTTKQPAQVPQEEMLPA